MDRKDIEGFAFRGRVEKPEKVVLVGNGREAELLVAGLRVLAGQIAIRDSMTLEGLSHYGTGGREQGRGVPLIGEVEELLSQIVTPNYVAEEDDEEGAGSTE